MQLWLVLSSHLAVEWSKSLICYQNWIWMWACEISLPIIKRIHVKFLKFGYISVVTTGVHMQAHWSQCRHLGNLLWKVVANTFRCCYLRLPQFIAVTMNTTTRQMLQLVEICVRISYFNAWSANYSSIWVAVDCNCRVILQTMHIDMSYQIIGELRRNQRSRNLQISNCLDESDGQCFGAP